MVNIIPYAIVCCFLVAGCHAESHTCYFCEALDEPIGSDCWDRAADTAKVVNCSLPCYMQTFQSGGGADPDNFWSIKRGCTGLHNEQKTCEESSNCNNRYFGACTTCCSTSLCNTASAPIHPLPILIATFLTSMFVFFQTI